MEVQEPFRAEAWNDLSEEISFGRAQREVLRGVPLKPAMSNWLGQLPRTLEKRKKIIKDKTGVYMKRLIPQKDIKC